MELYTIAALGVAHPSILTSGRSASGMRESYLGSLSVHYWQLCRVHAAFIDENSITLGE